MKKLALLAATAAFIIPGMAQAGWNDDHMTTTRTYEETRVTTYDNDGTDVIVRVQNPNDLPPNARPLAPRTYNVVSRADSILVDGEAIYIVTDSGFKYPAPDGPYTTDSGLTFVSEDGIVLRTEGPQEIVYVDADFTMDADHDGNYGDIDADVDTRTTTTRYNW